MTRAERTSDEVGLELLQLLQVRDPEVSAVDAVVIASVVPALNPAFIEG